MLIPADFTVEAPGTLEPAIRQEVFAPRTGLVDEVLVADGADVTAGAAARATPRPIAGARSEARPRRNGNRPPPTRSGPRHQDQPRRPRRERRRALPPLGQRARIRTAAHQPRKRARSCSTPSATSSSSAARSPAACSPGTSPTASPPAPSNAAKCSSPSPTSRPTGNWNSTSPTIASATCSPRKPTEETDALPVRFRLRSADAAYTGHIETIGMTASVDTQGPERRPSHGRSRRRLRQDTNSPTPPSATSAPASPPAPKSTAAAARSATSGSTTSGTPPLTWLRF